MGFLRQLLTNTRTESHPIRAAQGLAVRADAEEAGQALVELEIVGESYRQDALVMLSGPKEPDGKEMSVGVTLRCEPQNAHDGNAVRVEVMGQHVGYVARDEASRLSPAMQRLFGGSLEATGLIVGGWNGPTEGHYGIRVWITAAHAQRLGLPPEQPPTERPARQPSPYSCIPEPDPSERRLTPEADDRNALPSSVTVTAEEHYQDAILASQPPDWDRDYWLVVVRLRIASSNPHAKHPGPCIEVQIDDKTIGYFTPAMTERHRPSVESAERDGARASAVAQLREGSKGGMTFWRATVALQLPADTPVELIPKRLVNLRTGTSHYLGEQLVDGNWRADCGTVIPAAEVRVLCYTKPSGRIVDYESGEPVVEEYPACDKC